MNDRPAIYLDIDGVLNYARLWEAGAFEIKIAPRKLRALNGLVDRADADVVLSSMWRGRATPAEISAVEATLIAHGGRFTFAGATPPLWRYGQPRWLEIATERLAAGRSGRFVVFDDDADAFNADVDPFCSLGLFRRTTIKHGLTRADLRAAEAWLTGGPRP